MGRRVERLTMGTRALFTFSVQSFGAQGVGGTGESVYGLGGAHVLRYALVRATNNFHVLFSFIDVWIHWLM